MKNESLVLNLSDLDTRRRLMQKIGGLSGLWEVTLKERKRTRSLDANRYYFVAVVQPFAAWLSEIYGEEVGNDQAHQALSAKVLGTDAVVDKRTGDIIAELPRRTKTMDTGEFSDYIERCARFLAEFCNVVVIPSEEFWESKDKLRRAS